MNSVCIEMEVRYTVARYNKRPLLLDDFVKT